MNFYNEHDPKAAAWIRELITHGHLPAGIVDERSIEDITPNELTQFTQCHFFAGIGGWSLALRLSGWPEDRPVWTGSCPCQPFSTAGKGGGFDDERHLWPAFHHLISQCQPPVVFGEQVASKDGLGWLDLVRADLEASGYAVGASDLCAASVGAPHIRQRLWWVADRIVQGLEGHRRHGDDGNQPGRVGANATGSVAQGGDVDGVGDADGERKGSIRGVFNRAGAEPDRGIKPDRLAHADRPGSQPGRSSASTAGHGDSAESDGSDSRMADASNGSIHRGQPRATERGLPQGVGGNYPIRPSPLHGFWRDADWLHCRDGKWRPVEPGTFPLAHGVSARVVRLRGYGNAIVPQVAAEFVSAYLEAIAT